MHSGKEKLKRDKVQQCLLQKQGTHKAIITAHETKIMKRDSRLKSNYMFQNIKLIHSGNQQPHICENIPAQKNPNPRDATNSHKKIFIEYEHSFSNVSQEAKNLTF